MSEKLIKDAGMNTLSSLDFQTKIARDSFFEILGTATLPNGIRKANHRKQIITSMRAFSDGTKDNWKSWFAELSQLEKEIEQQKTANSDILKDTIGQISFQHEHFKHLNYLPFVLMVLSIFKIYLVPTMAILMPFLTILLPYAYIRYVAKLPIPFSNYLQLIWKMWMGEGTLNTRSAVQGLTFLFTFAQGVIQPIQNARHCANTDAYLLTLGGHLNECKRLLNNIEESCKKNSIPFKFPKGFQETFHQDTRQLAVGYLENSLQFDTLFKILGKLECMFVISQQPEFHPVSFLKPSPFPYLQISGLQDLQIPKHQRVLSDIHLINKKHHSLVTGPNGGGKSSSLRAILQSVLFAQTFGYAAAESMTLRPFRWILSGLLLQDTPGKKSMFESEVQFAVSLLQQKTGPGLVLFDELFHSTNPPDGIRTASCFLQSLWKKPNIASVVSTHVFELVEKAPKEIQRLCVPGTKTNDGSFLFSYKLQQGICTLSSVERIWKKQGLKCG